MAGDILIFIEHRDGKIRKSALEALSEGKRLATATGGKAYAILIGKGVESLATEATAFGADAIYIVDDQRLAAYAPTAYARTIAGIAKRIDPSAILFTASAMGKDLAPTVAAFLQTSVAADCTGLSFSGGRLTITRPVYAGKLRAEIAFKSAPAIVSLRPNVFTANAPDRSRTAAVEKVAATFEANDIATVVRELTRTSTGKAELTEASIVVSGGRGMKGPENFKLIEELADVLGAAVGASRAVVDAGWRPHAEQVGQTGKTVSPNLYIACGISGAIQHLAGISSSNTIVAINKDPEANIFKVANYGIVGDALEVLPALTREFKKIL